MFLKNFSLALIDLTFTKATVKIFVLNGFARYEPLTDELLDISRSEKLLVFPLRVSPPGDDIHAV